MVSRNVAVHLYLSVLLLVEVWKYLACVTIKKSCPADESSSCTEKSIHFLSQAADLQEVEHQL